MVLLKLIVFVSICYVVNAASINPNSNVGQGPQGYLVFDMSRKPGVPAPSCFPIKTNQICPNSLFTHKVVGLNQNLPRFDTTLQAVKLQLNAVKFFKGTKKCLDDIREYSCSNTLLKCQPSKLTPFGFKLDFDVKRTETACNNVKKSCLPIIQAGTIYNCSTIQRDPMEFLRCVKIKSSPNDVCPPSSYKYPYSTAKFYRTHVDGFQANLKMFKTSFRDASCTQSFINVYCQILRGPICSDDVGATKRMFSTTKQECTRVVNNCVTDLNVKGYILEVCKLLPDQSAPRIPLPTVPLSTSPTSASTTANSNNAGNVVNNSGK